VLHGVSWLVRIVNTSLYSTNGSTYSQTGCYNTRTRRRQLRLLVTSVLLSIPSLFCVTLAFADV
jgi:hypothetical protein